MSLYEWWDSYASEAAWHAEQSRNRFFSCTERKRHQFFAARNYAEARKVLDLILERGR